MPNTLVHIGLQAPLTRLGLKTAPVQWIIVGCIIPDIPWIIQRILTFFPGGDLIDLRLYTVAQASLIYCLILSLALSMFSSKWKQIFLILGVNCFLHLLLDATQNKWGNGVNLLVPFSWHSTNFGLFWPENYLNYLLTLTGLFVCIFLWPKAIRSNLLLQKPRKVQSLCATLCLVIYLGSPFLLIETAYKANVHYSHTLRNSTDRIGKKLAIDRADYDATTNSLSCYGDKGLTISNLHQIPSATISIQGYFLTENMVELQKFHIHTRFRDYASYTGLLLALILWIHSLAYQKYL